MAIDGFNHTQEKKILINEACSNITKTKKPSDGSCHDYSITWLVIATCLTFTYKLFLINSSLEEANKMGTLTFQCIIGNTLHPDLCTVLTAPEEPQDKPQWRLQKKKKKLFNIPQISFQIQCFKHEIIS